MKRVLLLLTAVLCSYSSYAQKGEKGNWSDAKERASQANKSETSPTISKATQSGLDAEAKGNIDWGWTNHGVPDNVCAQDEISSSIKRGGKTPRQCLEAAIAAASAGDKDLAFRWIVTIQCHNQRARNSLLQAGKDATVDYLVSTYGG